MKSHIIEVYNYMTFSLNVFDNIRFYDIITPKQKQTKGAKK